jgi:hypothetical protein
MLIHFAAWQAIGIGHRGRRILHRHRRKRLPQGRLHRCCIRHPPGPGRRQPRFHPLHPAPQGSGQFGERCRATPLRIAWSVPGTPQLVVPRSQSIAQINQQFPNAFRRFIQDQRCLHAARSRRNVAALRLSLQGESLRTGSGRRQARNRQRGQHGRRAGGGQHGHGPRRWRRGPVESRGPPPAACPPRMHRRPTCLRRWPAGGAGASAGALWS